MKMSFITKNPRFSFCLLLKHLDCNKFALRNCTGSGLGLGIQEGSTAKFHDIPSRTSSTLK